MLVLVFKFSPNWRGKNASNEYVDKYIWLQKLLFQTHRIKILLFIVYNKNGINSKFHIQKEKKACVQFILLIWKIQIFQEFGQEGFASGRISIHFQWNPNWEKSKQNENSLCLSLFLFLLQKIEMHGSVTPRRDLREHTCIILQMLCLNCFSLVSLPFVFSETPAASSEFCFSPFLTC